MCADLTGCSLGAFHSPAGLGGSAAGKEMLAQRIADSAKLTHEKRIIKKIRNVIANSFWEQECFVSFFSLFYFFP